MTLLSHHIDALFAAVSSVLEGESLDLKPRHHEVQTTIDAVLSVVHRAIAAHSERWNSRTAILPPELLIGCFESLAFDDCLRVSGVSRHWRRIALSTPALWLSFSVPHDNRKGNGKLEEMLRRSQAAPLSVQVYGTDYWSQEATRELLRPQFARIRSLTCEYPLGYPEDMPLLEWLECTGHDAVSEFALGWSSQRLRVLRLNRFHIRPGGPIFSSLREFRGEFTTHTSLSRLLSVCPSLESLAIKCGSSLGVDPRPLFVALPSSLLEVSITGIYYQDNPELDPTGAWSGHRFRLLTISCLRNMSSAFRLFESALSPSAARWSLELFVDKKILYVLEAASAQTRVEGPGYTSALAAEAVSNLQHSQIHLRRLTSLHLPLRYLKICVESGLALPALTGLTFTVHPERDHKPAVPDVSNTVAMIVPRLQSFTFLFRGGSSDTNHFTTNTVRFFFRLLPKRLRLWMHYDAEMLERIALLGYVPYWTLWDIDPNAPDLHALGKVVHFCKRFVCSAQSHLLLSLPLETLDPASYRTLP